MIFMPDINETVKVCVCPGCKTQFRMLEGHVCNTTWEEVYEHLESNPYPRFVKNFMFDKLCIAAGLK